MENIPVEKLRKFIAIDLFGASKLDLSKRKLSKVPEAVTDLTDVEGLKLSQNCLVELPTNINKLKNLTYLDLDNNQFSQLCSSRKYP